MAGEYGSSVKFDSAQAERAVTSLSGKIGNLRTKLGSLRDTAKGFDGAWRSANSTMGASANKAAQLERSLTSVGRGARTARDAVKGFVGSLNTGEISKAAGIVKSLGTHLTTTATRMRQMRDSGRTLGPLMANLSKNTVRTGLAFENFGKRLDGVIPKMQRASAAAAQLNAQMAGLNHKYNFAVTGLGRLSAAHNRSQNATRSHSTTLNHGTVAVNKYAHALGGAQNSLLGFGSGLIGVRNLGLYFLSGLGARAVAEYADSWNLAGARLGLVTDELRVLDQVQREVFESAQRTRTGFRENVTLFTKIAQAGERYGVSLRQALTVTENVQKAFKISGATPGESSAASLQLSQAFASGRFQGDELRSIFENAPRLAKALSEHLGVSLGEIRDLAKQGKIGIVELTEAFSNAKFTEQLQAEFEKIPVTMGDALTRAGNKFMKFVGDLDDAIGLSSKVVGVIELVSDNFDKIAVAAGLAGVALLASYVPAMVQAVKISRTFIALNLASYALGVRGSFGAAATSVGLFGGVFKRSATSTLPLWKQVLGNVTGAVTLSTGRILSLFKNLFFRLPVLAAVGTAALYAFSDDTKITAGQLATTNDYIVTGFQIAWGKISAVIGSVADWITGRIQKMVDDVIWLFDVLWRSIKFVYTAIKETLREVGHMVPGGEAPDWQGPYRKAKQAASTGLREDFSTAVQGTTWQKMAEARARARARGQGAGDPSLLGPDNPTLRPDPAEDDDKKKKGRDREDTIKRLKDEIRQMEAQFDETEAARQKFEDGVVTLNDAMKYGVINAADYSRLLKGLANDVFPGLRDEIKALNEEQASLRIKAVGGSEADVDIGNATRNAEAQLTMIDSLIAKNQDVNGVLAAQRDVILDQLDTYKLIRRENEGLEKIIKDREEAERQISEIIDNAAEKMQEVFRDRIRSMLDFGKNGFQNFFKGIISMFKDTLAEVLSASLFGPMREKFRAAMETALMGNKTNRRLNGVGIGLGSQSRMNELRDTVLNAAEPPVINISGSGGKARADANGTINIDVNATTGSPDPQDNQEITVTGARAKTGFLQDVATGYRNQVKGTVELIGRILKPIGKSVEKAAGKLGIDTKDFGKHVGAGIAGAQMGAGIADLGKMIGLKTSRTGGAIGGSIGAVASSITGIPGLDVIGSILGSVVGGMFKKTPSGSTTLSTNEAGYIGVGDASGTNAQAKQASSALGNSFKASLQQLADTMDAQLSASMNLGSIGMRKDKFIFDPSGMGRTKGSGVLKFATEEAVLEAALKHAIQSGVIKGLSETADRVLKTFKDVNRAVQVATTIEAIKKQAKALRDPVASVFEQIKKDMSDVIAMFQEAGASAEDYADLQTVIQAQFTEALNGQLDALKSFRDDLIGGDLSYKSASDKLSFADERFKELEGKIASGQYVDQGTFTSAGTTLSNLAREVYGSTPEFKAFQDRLIAATEKLMSNVQAEADKYKPMIDAIYSASGTAHEDATVTHSLLENLINNIVGGGGVTEYTGSSGGGGGSSNRFNIASF